MSTVALNEFIAIHEATHAVVAAHLRVPIESVDISGIQGTNIVGGCRLKFFPRAWSSKQWEKLILIKLAPEELQQIWFERMDDGGCSDDLRQAEKQQGTAYKFHSMLCQHTWPMHGNGLRK
jgi:hypothetical protein